MLTHHKVFQIFLQSLIEIFAIKGAHNSENIYSIGKV